MTKWNLAKTYQIYTRPHHDGGIQWIVRERGVSLAWGVSHSCEDPIADAVLAAEEMRRMMAQDLSNACAMRDE